MDKGILNMLRGAGAGRGAHKALDRIDAMLKGLPDIRLDQLVVDNAVLIIVDMVNGYVKSGALASPAILAINERTAALAAACDENGIPVAALADCHTLSSPEFNTAPTHCLEGSEETELTDEIKNSCRLTRIEKNSENGLLEPALKDWIKANASGTFVLVGCCTDTSVSQLALAIKTHYNRRNRTSRVIVPTACVATYDRGLHNAELTGRMALYSMMLGGVELCSDITL